MYIQQAEDPPREITQNKRLFKLRLTPTPTELFGVLKFIFFLFFFFFFCTFKIRKPPIRISELRGCLTHTERVYWWQQMVESVLWRLKANTARLHSHPPLPLELVPHQHHPVEQQQSSSSFLLLLQVPSGKQPVWHTVRGRGSVISRQI